MANKNTTPVKIWDLPIRIFHWLLVAAIGFLWWSGENGGFAMDWHMIVGVGVLALVLFRLVWGVVGSDTARFSQFLKSPKSAIHHLLELPQRKTAYHAGHNALGGWVVVVILSLLLVQSITGLFATDDILVDGPLRSWVSSSNAETLTSIHHLIFNLLLLVAVVHVLAVLFYRFYKQTNLIKAMVLGSADWPADQSKPALVFKSTALGLGLMLACYVLVRIVLALLA
ncbi:MAG: cytochrome b/b6 domain-containing protein [Thiofilum sp.]|uniref:cytochrome b/b6 domain-containing protein n=1 Tax=Thiofilum sp. TaxID=2212733 RepID=UPI0025CBAD8C|nr:cytochrome b/b6 domain-containing protein [Thiofilum sp.]MBK8451995.1 cytochrome b/b6 domain-containing protein [Thiofilum sp.]